MNDHEINTAIAEACGIPRFVKRWYYTYNGIVSRGHLSYESAVDDALSHCKFVEPEAYDKENPPADYCNDLNAMHEAEKILDDNVEDAGSKRYVYAGFLYSAVAKEQQPCRATARQRAEAFLRTFR